MSPALISRSPDLRRLQNEGYEVDVHGGYLVVSHVPYVTSDRRVDFGALVSELTLAGDRTTRPGTHVVYFTGSQPCHKDGTPIKGILHSEGTQQLHPGVVVQRSFSNKPPEGYADYHHKITRYAEILSAPAMALDTSATARTFRPIPSQPEESPFAYVDTNATRGHFQAITAKLQGQKIGIVGLGGTGSYVLDLVAKTPVAEIRLFDGDRFLQHNAFRAPGAPTLEELGQAPFKVDHFAQMYSRMHRGILAYPKRITSANISQLDGLNFVFLSMDSGSAKREIIEYLLAQNIPFVDAGIGVQAADDRLLGVVRVTAGSAAKRDHLTNRISYAEAADDAYSTNIQIAELNMLNAALAVIRWKKHSGFYVDFEKEHHSTYTIDGNHLLNEDLHA